MVDQIVTKQKLIDANKNADSWEKYWSGNEDENVLTHLNKTYPTHAKALKTLMENGGIQPFETQDQLLASIPIVDPTAAKALDTKKVWLWKDGAWIDTGLSELDQAKDFTKERIDLKPVSRFSFAINDVEGNVPFAIGKNGDVEAYNLLSGESFTTAERVNGYVKVWTDAKGNLVLGIKSDGTVYAPKFSTDNQNTQQNNVKTLSITNSDTIMHIGDSMTAAHYVGENKGYVSQLSQLSPFRHVNYGVTDTNLLDMQNRIINDVSVFGASLKSVKPKYLFIASYANDGQYFNAGMQYFQENTRRLIDVALAYGVQPVLIAYFFMTSEYHQAIKSIADEYQIPVIYNDVMNKQIGFYNTVTLFHQWHVGSRTSALWWIPMLEYVNQQNPMRTLKIFRKRAGFNANLDSDLLFKGMVDKTKKWKELTIGHYSLKNEAKYDELDTLEWDDFYPFIYHEDEYVKISNKQAVSFSDYALIEMSFDAYSKNIESISINLNLIGSPLCFVRDNIAPESALPNGLPTDQVYQDYWNKPRGAWRGVDLINNTISIAQKDIAHSMVGNKLYLMIKGAFDLTDLSVEYSATKYESSLPTLNKTNERREHLGPELLAQPLLGNAAQLAEWVRGGVVSTLTPIDNAKSPRKPNQLIPVDGVVTLTTSNHVQQTVNFPVSEEVRTFKVVGWSRIFPKGFLDRTNPAYSDLDSSQILDRSAPGIVAPINKNTPDVEELKLETWVDAPPVAGGALHFGYVSLVWRPVSFYVEVQPYESNLSIRFSAASGEIQLSKCSVKEVL